MAILWILISVAVLGVVLAIIFFYFMKKGKVQTIDYKMLFVLGFFWGIIGLVSKNPAMWIIGLVFVSMGLLNKNKWGKKIKLTKKQRKLRMIIIGVLVLLLALGAIVFSLMFYIKG